MGHSPHLRQPVHDVVRGERLLEARNVSRDSGKGVILTRRDNERHVRRFQLFRDRVGQLAMKVHVHDGTVETAFVDFLKGVIESADRADDFGPRLHQGPRQIVGKIVFVFHEQHAQAAERTFAFTPRPSIEFKRDGMRFTMNMPVGLDTLVDPVG